MGDLFGFIPELAIVDGPRAAITHALPSDPGAIHAGEEA
jgi:hypothetical protein